MNTIEQAREVSAQLHLGASIANDRNIDKDFAILAKAAGNTIDGLIAELAALSLDLHTETAAVIALRTELIEIKAQFEMVLEREVYWNSRWVLVSDQLASIKGQQPVLEVSPYDVNTFYWINNDEVDKAHCGVKLYLSAGAQPIPAGYQLVPVEPTEAMCKAADDSDAEYSLRNFGPGVHAQQSGYDHYCAMLAAAKEKS